MRFNSYDRALPPELDGVDKDRLPLPVDFWARLRPSHPGTRPDLEAVFGIDAQGPLAMMGCGLAYGHGGLTCSGRGPVGAMRPDGARFDLPLPFGFPFAGAMQHVASGRSGAR
jgi:hypothetical protein